MHGRSSCRLLHALPIIDEQAFGGRGHFVSFDHVKWGIKWVVIRDAATFSLNRYLFSWFCRKV